MTLASRFKADTNLANEGVWFNFPESPNLDKTVPGFLLGRNSSQNKRFSRAVAEVTARYLSEHGVARVEDLPDDLYDQFDVDLFLEGVLLDWRNFQPADDGVNVEYSAEAAKEYIGNPDWADLYNLLRAKAIRTSNYQSGAAKEDAGK